MEAQLDPLQSDATSGVSITTRSGASLFAAPSWRISAVAEFSRLHLLLTRKGRAPYLVGCVAEIVARRRLRRKSYGFRLAKSG